MGWITPKVTWTPEPIYNADLNRIEGNLEYLREETATFNGLKSFSGGLTLTGGVLNARPNTDTVHTIGRAKIYGASGDVAIISHYDFNTSTGFSWKQNSLGDTVINSATGRTSYLKIGNSSVATFSGSAISLLKPTTISGSLTCSTINTGQGANELYGMNQSVKTTDSPTFAGATINGHINPTTTPTESTTATISAVGQTVYLPRGIYQDFGLSGSFHRQANTSGIDKAELQYKNLSGVWVTIDDIGWHTVPSGDINNTYTHLFPQGTTITSGAEYRIKIISLLSTSSFSLKLSYRKL